MDLRIPGASNVSGAMTGAGASGISGTSNAASSDVYEPIGCGYGGMLGLSISTTCGANLPSVSTPGSSIFPYGSIYGSSNSLDHRSSYYDSAPPPGISTSLMRRPCLSVEVQCLGCLLTNILMRAITVSGMEIKSQIRRNIFFAVFK